MKKIFKLTVLLAALTSSFVVAEITSLRGDQEVGELNKVPTNKPYPKEQPKMALNYVNQPPMVPHSVENYHMSPANNDCLQCHDVNNYIKTGATRISPTHFTDRDHQVLGQVAGRRYFCLQCHTPQVADQPIVANDFTAIGKFTAQE